MQLTKTLGGLIAPTLLIGSVAIAQTETFNIKHPNNAVITEFASEGGSRIQFFAATTNRGKCTKNPAIIMVPGLGLSTSMYTSTPDNRESWVSLLTAKGYDVYTLDAPYTEPSGIDPSRTDLTVASLDRAFSKWGFGDDEGNPYPNSQYPVDYLAQLEASFPQYFSPRAAGQYASVAIANNLQALLADVGPAILMAHSAAGEAAFTLLDSNPMLNALVVLEPVGCPSEAITEIPAMADTPLLAVYGDFVAARGQSSRYQACKASVEALQARGDKAEFIDLPAMGIEGNSHLFTQAYNNAQIADLVAAQLASWAL